MQTVASTGSIPSIPPDPRTLRKTNGGWSLMEKNLLRRASLRVADSSRDPDRIVIMGEPRRGTIAEVVGHNRFTVAHELPDWFRRLTDQPS